MPKANSLTPKFNFPVREEYLLFLIPFLSIPGNWLFPGFFIIAVFILFIANSVVKNNLDFKIADGIKWLLLLFWGLYIAAKSPNSFEGYKYYVGIIVVPFMIYQMISNINLTIPFLKKLVISMIGMGVVLGTYSITVFVSSGLGTKQRIPSIWSDFNIVAAVFMILLFFNLTILLYREKGKSYIWFVFSFLILLMGLFLTQTRGVWMATLIALGFYIIKRPKIILPASLVLSAITLLFYNVILDRFLSVKNFGYDLSSLGRLQAWLSSVILIKENPFLGYGFDAYIHLRDSVFPAYFVNVIHSHNTYLRMILETGIIGFILYMSFLIIAFYSTFKINKYKTENIYRVYSDALQLSFIGLFVAFMFEPYFSLHGVSTIIIWIFIAIAIKIHRQLQAGNKQEVF